MINQKDRKFFEFSGKEKDLSKSTYSWSAQYDEEDDFLRGKISNSLPDFSQEALFVEY
jgi:hypothetical protein